MNTIEENLNELLRSGATEEQIIDEIKKLSDPDLCAFRFVTDGNRMPLIFFAAQNNFLKLAHVL